MTERWRPKKRSTRDAYFSHKTGVRLLPTNREYVPSAAFRRERDVTPSLETTACFTAKVQTPEYTGPGAVMPGHKAGYQLITDPDLIKVMGKKNAY